jgi:RNA polymerase sigma-70 factor (ECF subfamily)
LYRRYFDRLYGYTRTILSTGVEAEDVVQQVFVAVLEALPSYDVRTGASFRGWLFVIARNKALKQRRADRHASLAAPDEIAQLQDTLSCEPVHGVEWLADGHLAGALRQLPPVAREMVLLRYAGDLRLAEIATVMGISEDAVKQAHRRALRFLHKRLTMHRSVSGSALANRS